VLSGISSLSLGARQEANRQGGRDGLTCLRAYGEAKNWAVICLKYWVHKKESRELWVHFSRHILHFIKNFT
jgi:hypothetical protein